MKTLLVCTVLVAGSATVAHAGESVLISGDAPVSGISGHAGHERVVGFTARDNVWLHEIAWSERYDDPCFIHVSGTRFVDGTLEAGDYRSSFPVQPFRQLAMCKQKSASMKVLDVKSRAIRAIQVCTNKAKQSDWEALKGIRVWTAAVDTESGTVSSEMTREHAQRTNCHKDRWHKKVECPAGQVAVGLRVFGGSKIVGLGLVCGRLSKGMTRPKQE